jgi:FtsP/CotA-like multicopper oxidase with cupredoxin domain
MWTRRQLFSRFAAAAGGAALLSARPLAAAQPDPSPAAPPANGDGSYTPVTTPNGASLPWKWVDGAKEFRLVAEPVDRQFADGMTVKCWGYNGLSPGPTIEAVEGDRVRIYVTNRLPEHTTVHWHGILLPNGMDGVGGLNQPHIEPGETYVYEFTLRQHGTYMYHPHADEMVQMAFGMMGLLVVHPRVPEPVERDFGILLHAWAVHPGSYRPDPSVMLDFNLFTFNGRVFPGTAPLVATTGDRVRIRIGNLSMDEHPIHLHGYAFDVVGTDGGPIPKSARWPLATVQVPVGSTRTIEFTADAPGDWALHCHKSHHTMNAMGHGVPNVVGAKLGAAGERLRRAVPGAMVMGERGMAEHADHAAHMEGPENTLPMMMGRGPHGNIEMGGMFSVLKVRDELAGAGDPGWYRQPPGTSARKV